MRLGPRSERTRGRGTPLGRGALLHALPDSAVGAFAENSLLQALVPACLVGAALLHLGHSRVPAVLPAVEQAQDVVFTVVGFIMRLAPLAVFGATAHLIGEYGLDALTTTASSSPSATAWHCSSCSSSPSP